MYRSGLIALDSILGQGGGIPEGSLIELYGAPDSGKTALALWYCRTTLEDPETVVGWVATESHLSKHSLDWASIPPERFLLVRQSPDTPGLKAVIGLLDSGCDLVVIDSIAALIDTDVDFRLGALLSRDLPLVKRATRANKGAIIFTNQERTIGKSRIVMSAGAGPALLRTMDYRVRLHTGENLYRGGIQTGIRVNFEVVKNGETMEGIGRSGRLSIYWDRGYRDLKSVISRVGG